MPSTAPSLGCSVALAALVISGCAELPERTALATIHHPSPNFDQRRPQLVVLHHTGSSNVARALATLSTRERAVSAHYVVARDGRIYHMVDELARAWHAGESFWAGQRDVNSASIGIEVDNDGNEPYPDVQLESLLALLADLRERYRIPRANFIGHADVAPQRKADPGGLFPWRRLATRGFGVWCEPPFEAPPAGVGDTSLLAAFGYDVSDADAAASAFRLHFVPEAGQKALSPALSSGLSSALSSDERARLWCLVERRNRADN